MSLVGRYLVCGKRQYRGHKPGSIFEAILDPGAERRALERGNIRLLERVQADLRPGSYSFPAGWPDRVVEPATEEPSRVSPT